MSSGRRNAATNCNSQKKCYLQHKSNCKENIIWQHKGGKKSQERKRAGKTAQMITLNQWLRQVWSEVCFQVPSSTFFSDVCCPSGASSSWFSQAHPGKTSDKLSVIYYVHGIQKHTKRTFSVILSSSESSVSDSDSSSFFTLESFPFPEDVLDVGGGSRGSGIRGTMPIARSISNREASSS